MQCKTCVFVTRMIDQHESKLHTHEQRKTCNRYTGSIFFLLLSSDTIKQYEMENNQNNKTTKVSHFSSANKKCYSRKNDRKIKRR